MTITQIDKLIKEAEDKLSWSDKFMFSLLPTGLSLSNFIMGVAKRQFGPTYYVANDELVTEHCMYMKRRSLQDTFQLAKFHGMFEGNFKEFCTKVGKLYVKISTANNFAFVFSCPDINRPVFSKGNELQTYFGAYLNTKNQPDKWKHALVVLGGGELIEPNTWKI